MALVFEIRTADNLVQLDLSKRVTRWLGTVTIPANQPTGVITHPDFGTQGRPCFRILGNWPGNFPGAVPWIIDTPNSLRWEYKGFDNSPISVTIGVGVF